MKVWLYFKLLKNIKKKKKKKKKKKWFIAFWHLFAYSGRKKEKTLLAELTIWPYGEYRGWHQQWYENHSWGWYVIWIENRLGPRLIIKVHLFKSPKWIKEPKIKDRIFFQIRVFWSYLHIPYIFCWQNTNLIVGGSTHWSQVGVIPFVFFLFYR